MASRTSAEPAVEARGYEVRRRETIAQAPGLRVRILSLSEGQRVPWHSHTSITDTFVCLDGPMQVRTRSPEHVHDLGPGEMLAVPAGSAHYVCGVDHGPCRFLIVQGVGEYDFVPQPPG